ncbi:MAG: hypothetical protein E7029_03385 [Planctomycetaceae bacterium]|nr:hypothetical protein [Planctomycetaceae bacterium]
MILGPIFHREAAIAPRRTKLYASRTAYTAALLILTATAWLIVSGSQLISDIGDMARFGNSLFSLLAPLQLVLAMFFSAMFAAGNVSQEKDRNTLVLLLLTRMNNSELVLGKLGASLLHLFVNLLAAVPVFFMVLCFGGVSLAQVIQCLAITFSTVLLCGTLGTLIAFWREQTFQAVSMTALLLVVWLALGECLASGLFGTAFTFPMASGTLSAQELAAAVSPWRAVLSITRFAAPTLLFPVFAAGISVILAFWTILRVRAWNSTERRREDETHDANPSQNSSAQTDANSSTQTDANSSAQTDANSSAQTDANSSAQTDAQASHSAKNAKRSRIVWDNPILWREICTKAYGKRAFLVRLSYVLLFALTFWCVHLHFETLDLSFLAENTGVLLFSMKVFLPLALLALVLVNAQAVTAITGERDGRALDLLRVTDLSPKEIVFGKLGGVFWNTREIVFLPLLFPLYLWSQNIASGEIVFYLSGGLAVLFLFAAMLGIHSGMTYAGSRSAIGVSLGTLFFLFVGVAVCLRMMLSMGGAFHAQIQPFLAFMAGGGLAMFLALGARNPSSAIGLASFGCPFATFYAMSALMMDYTLGVFLVVAVTYGFTTAAMLIPAISEFDIAVHQGRSEE